MSRLDVGAGLRSLDRFVGGQLDAWDDHRRRRAEQRRAGSTTLREFAYLHVPKSAGSSVIASLRSAAPDHRWAPWEFDPVLFGPFREAPVPDGLAERVLPDTAALNEYDAAGGHYALPTLLERFDANDVAILLREPRSRVLSLYQYWRGLSDELHDQHRPWTSSRTATLAAFDEWLDDPSIAYQTDNAVVRQILGVDPAIPDDDVIAPERLAGLTRRAIAAIRPIGWVGLVEQGDEMWRSLGDRIGSELVVERQNVSDRRSDLPTDVDALFSERAVVRLAARTAGDRAVWSAAARRLGVANPDLLADVVWFRRLGQAVAAESAVEGPE